jgi:hypothetical protein
MSLILSDCNDITRQILIKKAYKALPKMGALIVVDTITDDLRCENAFALSYSLLQLVAHGADRACRSYSFREFRKWTLKAGFSQVFAIQLPGQPLEAAMAIK